MSHPEFKNQSFRKRLSNALAGIFFCWQQEHSFKTQTVLTLVTLFFFAALQPRLIWWAFIILCIGLILAAEALNTALEVLIDHLHPDIHPAIGNVKDILAGMVLLLSIMAALIALLAIADTLF